MLYYATIIIAAIIFRRHYSVTTISHRGLSSLDEFARRICVMQAARSPRNENFRAVPRASTRFVSHARFRWRKLPINKMHASIASVQILCRYENRARTEPRRFYGARNFL